MRYRGTALGYPRERSLHYCTTPERQRHCIKLDFSGKKIESGLIQVEELFHLDPAFPFRPFRNRLQTWSAKSPPFPIDRSRIELSHVLLIIVTVVFIITENITALIKDGIILNPASTNQIQHLRPNRRMKPFVFFKFLRLNLDDHPIPFHQKSSISSAMVPKLKPRANRHASTSWLTHQIQHSPRSCCLEAARPYDIPQQEWW